MEKVDRKTENNFFEQKEILDNLKNKITIVKNRLKEESYQKSTFTGLIAKMQSDILITKKQINVHSKGNYKSAKELEIQKFSQNGIKEKVNSMHSGMLKTISHNFINHREHEYTSTYYSTVIDQKAAFHSLM